MISLRTDEVIIVRSHRCAYFMISSHMIAVTWTMISLRIDDNHHDIMDHGSDRESYKTMSSKTIIDCSFFHQEIFFLISDLQLINWSSVYWDILRFGVLLHKTDEYIFRDVGSISNLGSTTFQGHFLLNKKWAFF